MSGSIDHTTLARRPASTALTNLATELAGEARISLNAARKLPELCIDGRPRSLNWIHRMAIHGRRGVRLESQMTGGRRCTSREAVQRFIQRLNAASSTPLLTEADAARLAHQQAERELDAAGI